MEKINIVEVENWIDFIETDLRLMANENNPAYTEKNRLSCLNRLDKFRESLSIKKESKTNG